MMKRAAKTGDYAPAQQEYGTAPENEQQTSIDVQQKIAEQKAGIYLDLQESFVQGVDSTAEKPNDSEKERIQAAQFVDDLNQYTQADFYKSLESKPMLRKEFESQSNKLTLDYKKRRQENVLNHYVSFLEFQQKEQELLKCFKIQNQNPDFLQKADNFKRLKVNKLIQSNNKAQVLKEKVAETALQIEVDKEYHKKTKSLVDLYQQQMWDSINTNQVVQSSVNMTTYMNNEKTKNIASQIKLKQNLKTRKDKKASIRHSFHSVKLSTDLNMKPTSLQQQDGASIHGDHFNREMISYQKAHSAVITLDNTKRNQPNLKLTNPLNEARKLTRQEIIQMRQQQTDSRKKDWKHFVGLLSQNPDALMSIVATPFEAEEILQGPTRNRSIDVVDNNKLFAKNDSIQNGTEPTRIHSVVSQSINVSRRKLGVKNNKQRPLTGHHQRRTGTISSQYYQSQQQNPVKARPMTGQVRQVTINDDHKFKEEIELFSQQSKSKVETVLKMINHNQSTPLARGNEQQIGVDKSEINLDQIIEEPYAKLGPKPQKPTRLFSAVQTKKRRLESAKIGSEHIRQNTLSTEPIIAQAVIAQPSISINQYTLQNDSLEGRQNVWQNQLSVNQLQINSNHTLSNFELTNKKLIEQQKQLKEQKQVEFLVNFNLSKKLLQEFGIQRDVQYFKDSTLQNLGVVSARKPDQQQACQESAEEIDWQKTPLFNNLKQSDQFNYLNNKLYLSEEQICYCINLLRYCSEQFENKEKLRQMFNLTIATTQYIYHELGLNSQFDKLSTKLDKQSIMDQSTCEKLLIRCQLLLQIRSELAKVFQQIAMIETLIFKFTQKTTLEEQVPFDEASAATKSKVAEIEQLCEQVYKLIYKVVEENQQVIGRAFVFQQLDLFKQQNLKIKMTSMLLKGLNNTSLETKLSQQVQEHRIKRKQWQDQMAKEKKEREKAQREKYNKAKGYQFQKKTENKAMVEKSLFDPLESQLSNLTPHD